MSAPEPPDPGDRPPDWNSWPRAAKAAYFETRFSRLEIVRQILEKAGREPDPERDESKYRLTKSELSAVLAEFERR